MTRSCSNELGWHGGTTQAPCKSLSVHAVRFNLQNKRKKQMWHALVCMGVKSSETRSSA